MTTSASARGRVLWQPPAGSIGPDAPSAAGRFAHRHGFADHAAMHRWSIEEPEAFWSAATAFTGVRWTTPPTAMRDGDAMPGTRWFPDASLNYTDHALAATVSRAGEPAIIAHSQTRPPVSLSWLELRAQVVAAADGLRRLGVSPGDRVAAYAPNIPETVVTFLATAALGAVWTSCSPEFGVRAVVDRIAQIEPTVLVAVDGYRYGAKDVDRRDEVAAVVAAVPSVRHVVRIDYLGTAGDGSTAGFDVAEDVTVIGWADLLATDETSPGLLETVAVPADHPLYVLFSSGTTGLPKAIVHGHGGIVAEHLKVLTLHQDLRPDDRFCWFTTTGWMMWNFLVSGLLVGSTIVLFDGDPGSPSLEALWDVAAETGVTIMGVSAPFVMACRKAGIEPSVPTLRWVGSTGAPLPAQGSEWITDTLGVPVSSISGGTDVCTAFLGSSPLVAVRAGEISTRLLGCAVEAFTPDGRVCEPGETGELVITAPMPSMPVGFWGDDDASAYRAAYFEDFPGVWRHGDWITFTDDGACVISGRSDATLNRGGVRLGTSDFYAVVEAFDAVADSLVVHLEDDAEGGLGELRLFITVADGHQLGAVLSDEIRAALRRELSPRHVPDRIDAVPAIPRTLSGKKLEVPVKRILTGTPPEQAASRESLADPSALDWFVSMA